MSDERTILEGIRDGKAVAFAALYDKYVDRVWTYLYSILRDETLAEDITQMCFLYIWEHREHISPDKNFSSYLFTMARNYAFKELRRRLTVSRYQDLMMVLMDKEHPSPDIGLDVEVIRREVDRVVASLPESRRRIYLLRTLEHMEVGQIAQLLGISPKTVETQILRARSRIREALAGLT